MNTTTKTRGIIMGAESVRAILAGKKTQTRRTIKPQPKNRLIEGVAGLTIGMDRSLDGRVWYDADCVNPGREVEAPIHVGDLLYVKEAVRLPKSLDDKNWKQVAERCLDVGYSQPWAPCEYVADGRRENWDVACWGEESGKIRNPMFVPKTLSRIALEIADVRVEQVRDISDDDCEAEGVVQDDIAPFFWRLGKLEPGVSRRTAYAVAWDHINGNGNFMLNPWVWVYEFNRVDDAI